MPVELIPLDIDPFKPTRASFDATIRAAGSEPVVSPDVQQQRDQIRKDMLERERALPMTDEARVALEKEIAGTNRGRQITVERKPKAQPASFELVPMDIDPFATPKGEQGEFMKGLAGGLQGGTPKMFGSAMRGAGTMLGSDWLVEQGKRLADAGQKTLEGYQPQVGSIAKVRTDNIRNTLSDFFTKYLPYQTGNALASMAPTIASGLLGAGIGGAVGGPPGAVAGGLSGVVLSGYPMNYGDIYSSALDDPGIQRAVQEGKLTEKSLASITAAAAVPITALDSWAIGRLGSALTADAKRSLYKRIFAEMAAGSLREGSTEGLQQIMSEFTQQQLGSDKTATQSAIAVVDNAIGGMAGGGVTGGVAGAIQRQTALQQPPQAQPAQPPAGPGVTDVPRETPVPPKLGFQPGDPMVTFPDGTTMTRAEYEQRRADGMTGSGRTEPVQPDEPAPPEPPAQLGYQAGPPMVTFPDGTTMTQAEYQQRLADGITGSGTPQVTEFEREQAEKTQRNETLRAIYGDNQAVTRVIEGDMESIANALYRVAPTVERVRAGLPQAEEDRDITQDIVGALDQMAMVKQSGQTIDQVLALNQEEMSYEEQTLARFLNSNIDNPQRVADFLESYLEIVENMGGVPSEVRGRAFDIINERNAQRKQADADKKAIEKQKAFEKQEKATPATVAKKTAAAADAAIEREVTVAKAAGSGVNAEHKTAIELAFESAGKLKGKKRGRETGDAVRAGAQSDAQAADGQGAGLASEGAGTVPEPVQTDEAGTQQPVRAQRGDEGTQENRGLRLIYDRKRAEQVRGVAVQMRAIDQKTGRRMKVRMPAAKAVQELNRQIRVMEELLACLYS